VIGVFLGINKVLIFLKYLNLIQNDYFSITLSNELTKICLSAYSSFKCVDIVLHSQSSFKFNTFLSSKCFDIKIFKIV